MNFDEQIAEKKQQKQQLVDAMEIKKELFLEELIKYTIDWFEKTTLSIIKDNPEKVIGLGEVKARELKGNLKGLKEKSPELVQQYLGDKDFWWHTNEDSESHYNSHRLMNKHEEQIKLMFGELGNILIQYEIESVSSGHGTNYSSQWNFVDYNRKKVKYGYGLAFPSELIGITNGYRELIMETQDINREVEELEENKKKDNVEEWWASL
ncbi:hypothetical protein COE84_28370 [Bacillus wiedmannii]|uniref:hypothetical protein n=1 Tax=Bacillus wiedmannii TaxID=1890302 RepID=UPI000BFBB705|nr:hypothetical protein [Bacillus wiedmannii]PHB06792.1 hypothetical protein COE84_28370 [Bacillus wiedmannii]